MSSTTRHELAIDMIPVSGRVRMPEPASDDDSCLLARSRVCACAQPTYNSPLAMPPRPAASSGSASSGHGHSHSVSSGGVVAGAWKWALVLLVAAVLVLQLRPELLQVLNGNISRTTTSTTMHARDSRALLASSSAADIPARVWVCSARVSQGRQRDAGVL